MSDFDDLNEKISQSPTATKVVFIFIKVMSIAIILMGMLLCLATPVGGIISVLFGVLLFFIAKNLNVVQKNDIPCEFDFPETDEQGHHLLTVYDVNVVGVMHEHDGIDPQTIIPKLYEGEQVILEADPLNSNDKYAVKVKTTSGIHIGWLPKGENLQIDISDRLNKGQTVYARVKKGYLLDSYPGKVGLVIDVARYSVR